MKKIKNILFISLCSFVFMLFACGSTDEDVDTSQYDTAKTYSVGETLVCPNWEVKIDSVNIKKKGAAIDSYQVVDDPEWIGVVLTVKNTSSDTKTFYNSNLSITNSSGEVINPSSWVYSIWGAEKLGSPELTSGGTKTGFVQFANTEDNNSNLILKVDCNTGFMSDDIVYSVNISQ